MALSSDAIVVPETRRTQACYIGHAVTILTESDPGLSAAAATRQASLSLKLAYPAAHFGKSVFWYSSESIFAYLLTEVIKLGPWAVGTILCASFLISAALDVGVGFILRRRLTTAASAAKLQLAGSAATSLVVILLFAIPAMQIRSPLPVAAVAVLLFRIAYAFIDIPQNAMLSIAIKSPNDRASLAASRLAASGLAALAVAATITALVYSSAEARPAMLVVASCTMAIMVTGVCALLRMVIGNLAAPSSIAKFASRSERPGVALSQLAWLLMTAQFVTSFASPIFTKLLPYYASVHLANPIRGASVIALVSVGMIIGQPLWLAVLRGRSNPFRISATSLATAAAAAFFCWAAQQGTWLLVPAACMFGMGSGGIGTTLWAAFADVVADENPGSEGFAFGLFTAAAKVSLAIGAIGVGWLLSEASFRQPGSRLLAFGMTLPAIGSGLLCGLAMGLWRRYAARRVDREKFTE